MEHFKPGLAFDEYLNLDAINASGLKDILKSSRTYHWKHILKNRKKETEAQRFGKLIHAAVLEPQRFLENVMIEPDVDGRTKEGKAAKIDFLSSITSKSIVVDSDDQVKLLGMIDALKNHKAASKLLEKGISEVTGIVDHEEFGLCKFRPDFITENGIIVDLKSTKDCSKESFMRDIAKYKYHLSCAFYVDLFEKLIGKKPKAFVWLAIEKEEPFELQIFVADQRCIEIGRGEYRVAIKKLLECKKTNVWPGISEGFQNISLPNWFESAMFYDDEDQDESQIRSE